MVGTPDQSLHSELLEAPYQLRIVGTDAVVAAALEEAADCVVITATAPVVDVHDLKALSSADTAVVVFVPVESHEYVAPLVRAGFSTFVFEDEAETVASTANRLREAIDHCYEIAISDANETVLEISRSLMGAAPDEIDVEIEWGLESVGRELNAERCLVYVYDEQTRQLQATHSWYRSARETNEAEQLDAGAFPGFESVEQFVPYAVPDEGGREIEFEVPEGFAGDLGGRLQPSEDTTQARSHPYLRTHELESFLAAPIAIDWELYGVIAVGQDHERTWPEGVRRQLQTLGELIGHTIEREARRQELKSKNDRLERFTSVVSHDLRNPLNVISGSAALIEETGERHYLTDIIESTNRMDEMIEELLTLAKSGDQLGERKPVSLERIVKSAWQSVETPEASLECRNLGVLKADPNRLQQVFENLFRNAIEHNGVDVSLLVEGTDSGFAIEDDGSGIPAELRTEIFEPGYTGGTGTGLGLSIVKTVLEAHGWAVTITDGTDGGARFEVEMEQPMTDPNRHAIGTE